MKIEEIENAIEETMIEIQSYGNPDGRRRHRNEMTAIDRLGKLRGMLERKALQLSDTELEDNYVARQNSVVTVKEYVYQPPSKHPEPELIPDHEKATRNMAKISAPKLVCKVIFVGDSVVARVLDGPVHPIDWIEQVSTGYPPYRYFVVHYKDGSDSHHYNVTRAHFEPEGFED